MSETSWRHKGIITANSLPSYLPLPPSHIWLCNSPAFGNLQNLTCDRGDQSLSSGWWTANLSERWRICTVLRQVRAAVGGLCILTLERFEEDFQLYLFSTLRVYRTVSMFVSHENTHILISKRAISSSAHMGWRILEILGWSTSISQMRASHSGWLIGE